MATKPPTSISYLHINRVDPATTRLAEPVTPTSSRLPKKSVTMFCRDSVSVVPGIIPVSCFKGPQTIGKP